MKIEDPVKLAANLVLLAAIVAFPAILLVTSLRMAGRRARDLSQIARSQNWEFSSRPPEEIATFVDRIGIADGASRKLFRNCVFGTIEGRGFVVTDFHRTGDVARPGSGYSSQTLFLLFDLGGAAVTSREADSTIGRLAHDHHPRMETAHGIQAYYITDLLVPAHHLPRFIRDGYRNIQQPARSA